MEINGFYKYDVHYLRPQTTESVEPEINSIGDKFQVKNNSTLHNDTRNSNSVILPPYYRIIRQWNFDELQDFPFLVRNNITVPIQKGIR